MTTEKATLTIAEFSTLLSEHPAAAPEIKAFGQLATIQTPAQVEEAISEAMSWGWH